MHIRFKLGLDKIDSLNYPSYEPEEIDVILNIQQERFIKQRANGNNPMRLSFEESQKRIDDLATLVVTTDPPLTATVTSDASIYTITLPNDYMQLERVGKINASGITCGNTPTSVVPFPELSRNDYIDKDLDDPYHKPNKDYIKYLREGNKLKFFTDGTTTISSVELTYIKLPLQLAHDAIAVNNPIGFTNDCKLPAQEIVDMAINYVLEVIGSPRYQSNSIDINKQE